MPRGRPLLRRLRLPFRHECNAKVELMVPQRRIERPTKAVPRHWTIAAQGLCGCGLENSPPASRLQGECSAR